MEEEEKISLRDFFMKPPFPPIPKALLMGDSAPPILEVIHHGVAAVNYQVHAVDQQINALDNLFKAIDKILMTGGDISKLLSPTSSKSAAKKASKAADEAGELEQVLTEFIKAPSDALISRIEELKESTNNRAIRAYLNAIVDAYKEGDKEEAVALASGVRRALRAISK